MRYSITIAILLYPALVACSGARTQEVYAPDGRQALAIQCSGSANSWSYCQKAASDRCGERGYDLLTRIDQSGQVAVVNYTPGVGLNAGSMPVYIRELLVACKS